MTQSSSIIYQALQNVPCGVLIFDQSGTINWLNPALESMLGLKADQLVGQNREQFPFTTHRGLFKGTGLMHLFGTGVEQERWLHCTVETRDDAEPAIHTIKYFQDVTELMRLREENQRLNQQVEELAITDELTGLANRQSLTRTLNTQVARSRRYQNPLSLAVIHLLDKRDETAIPDEIILEVSRYLRDRLRWVDLIARWEHSQFIIILPETSLQHGKDLMDKVLAGFSEVPLPASYAGDSLELLFGLAEWHKGQDARLLMKQALINLAENEAASGQA
ncbi:sensor domain-containing diguanylate cyclase [Sedimenticola sp.]|uniref:sensor domain-containing diguanylate cyclase n=1 Tax=Sedimenticola sp. TaxID=1940285 RepID=UPI002590A524|nr:diguanylate cyclase [Sedimenticola sp.]MCW8903684.1 diguanylate cyclase [Sedimenticola sp.]